MMVRQRKWETFLIAALITFSATQLGTSVTSYIVVWDVGQGQMVSWIEEETCSHFDLGGEKFPKEVIPRCRNKTNLLYVTHADFDHINFIPTFLKRVGELCLAEPPALLNKSWQWRYLSSLPPCLRNDRKGKPNIVTITPYPPREERDLKSLNAWSKIYVLSSKVLIPGDSTRTMEKVWLHQLEEPEKISHLVAGHHGSDTSTSEELLLELTGLVEVIVSARKARYGHPHYKMLRRVAKRRARVIRTETAGHHGVSP